MPEVEPITPHPMRTVSCSPHRGLRLILLGLVVHALLSVSPALAQSEDAVKAAFLYNFAKFTEWPAGAFPDAKAPIVIGFVGGGALADTFEKAVTGKNANGRDLQVKKLADAAGSESCHIVFVGDGAKTGAVVGQVKGKPVLTVSDAAGFVGGGGMIGFQADGGKVGFDMDLDPAKAANLKMDDKVKKIAKSVKGG